jgi:hypothetical protein
MEGGYPGADAWYTEARGCHTEGLDDSRFDYYVKPSVSK